MEENWQVSTELQSKQVGQSRNTGLNAGATSGCFRIQVNAAGSFSRRLAIPRQVLLQFGVIGLERQGLHLNLHGLLIAPIHK